MDGWVRQQRCFALLPLLLMVRNRIAFFSLSVPSKFGKTWLRPVCADDPRWLGTNTLERYNILRDLC